MPPRQQVSNCSHGPATVFVSSTTAIHSAHPPSAFLPAHRRIQAHSVGLDFPRRGPSRGVQVIVCLVQCLLGEAPDVANGQNRHAGADRQLPGADAAAGVHAVDDLPAVAACSQCDNQSVADIHRRCTIGEAHGNAARYCVVPIARYKSANLRSDRQCSTSQPASAEYRASQIARCMPGAVAMQPSHAAANLRLQGLAPRATISDLANSVVLSAELASRSANAALYEPRRLFQDCHAGQFWNSMRCSSNAARQSCCSGYCAQG